MRILTTILLILLLTVPVDAGKRRKSRAKGKGRAARVKVICTCPPPVIRYVADSVQVISQDEEAALQAAIARWMRGQPEMSDAAANKAREIAAEWWRRGRNR